MAPRFRLARTRLDTAQPAIPVTDVPIDIISPDRAERARLYKTPEWGKVRYRHLKAHPSCRVCRGKGQHVDHVVGHEDHQAADALAALGLRDRIPAHWRARFYIGPFVTLCHRCHSRKTKAETAGKLIGWLNNHFRPRF